MLTPTQIRLQSERAARLERFASRSVPDRPIVMLSASERTAAFVIPPVIITPEQRAEAEAAFSFKDWLERQDYLHPLQKEPWFSIEDEIKPDEPRLPYIEHIQKTVAKYYGMARIDMLSSRRTAGIVRPRQIAMYLAKSLTLRSFPDIGRRFGGRDHTTVLHAVKKIGTLILADTVLAAEIEVLKAMIGQVPA